MATLVTYVINSKSTESLQRVIEQFVSDCRHLPVLVARGHRLGTTKVSYPVKTIISDLERGLFNVHVPGVTIKQFNASESHRTLSRINPKINLNFMDRQKEKVMSLH